MRMRGQFDSHQPEAAPIENYREFRIQGKLRGVSDLHSRADKSLCTI